MAITFVKKSAIPQTRGVGATEPTVTVRENGALAFNKLAFAALGGGTRKLALVGFDENTRQVAVQAFEKPPKNFTEADCFHITYAEKLGIGSIAMSGFLKSDGSIEGLPNVAYDYKAVGNQQFPAGVDEKKFVVTFTLPQSASLVRHATVSRKKKATTAPAANAPATLAEDSDLESLD